MSKEIIFTKIINAVSDEYKPKPASYFLPDWYKKTQSYIDDKKEPSLISPTNATIKKCIPIFDALTSGYIIPTYQDLYISESSNGDIYYQTPTDINIEFHSTMQAPYHPGMNNNPYPKWINPWGIKTPKGYSCLFIPPVHGGNKYFSIMPGIVDTDKYTNNINFPFVLNDINFRGMIPAGTPMVQIILIKRNNWISKFGSQKNIDEANNNESILASMFFDKYKKIFWSSKSYR